MIVLGVLVRETYYCNKCNYELSKKAGKIEYGDYEVITVYDLHDSYQCSFCEEYFCSECMDWLNGKRYCQDCYKEIKEW